MTALRRIEPSWDVTVVTPAPGTFADRCRELGIAAAELPYPRALAALGESAVTAARRTRVPYAQLAMRVLATGLSLPRYLAELRGLLRDRQATVIHSNGVKAHIASALARPAGARLVWHLHEYVRPRPLTARLLRRLARRADAIVANSDSVMADAAAAFGSRADLRRIHNAVDLTAFSPDGHSLDLASLAGLPDDGRLVRIGLIATFARWKGHDVFIDALAQLAVAAPIRGYIIGAALYDTAGSQWSMADLKARVAAKGLSSTIGFTGHVDDVPAAMRALDIVVHASTEPEPFGMVIAEGMAAGRPVAIARAGGAAELFDDGVNAVGYAPGDAGELAARLRELIVDPARRSAIGAAARAAAVRRFSPDRMADAFREAYRR